MLEGLRQDRLKDRLIVLSWSSPEQVHTALRELEACFLHALLSKLALFTNTQYRDFATGSNRISLAGDVFSLPDMLARLAEIAESHESRYILCGFLRPSLQDPDSGIGTLVINTLHVDLKLYDAHEDRFTLQAVYDLDTFEYGCNTLMALVPTLEEMNRMINWGAFLLVNAIYPKQAGTLMSALANHRATNDYQALVQLVQAEQMTDSTTDRIEALEGVLQLDEQMEVAYYHLGRLYKSTRQYEKSLASYAQALAVSTASDTVKSLYATEAGIVCALLNAREQAIQWWRQSIALNPQYLNPYLNIGHLYEEDGDYEQAENFFRKAQMLAPGDSRIYYNLARIHSKQEAWHKALAQYQLQLIANRNDPWCHSNIATCYLQMGDNENALRHLERTSNLDPEGEAGEYARLIMLGLAAE
ncbi:MAG: tetratricopeptide repeat protein [Candidatus Melainabacteria bacterium]|nr:tetratricopeptide repeat protein [Candidatus Melainabacteria bacterium]